MRLTTTQYAVLGLIAFGERSGYELARGAERSVGAMWAPSRSQIYKVLPRLVELGCARVRHVEQEARPDKALYAISRRGREALHAWIDEVEDEPAGGAAVFLMKIFFGWAGSPESATAQLAAYEAHLRGRLARFRAMEEGLDRDEPVHSLVALRHATSRISATLAWAAEARALLAAAAVAALVLLVAAPSGSALDGCTPRGGDVSFRAADGIRLAGHVYGHGRIGIVLAHQSNGSVCQWRMYGPRLARLGYRALAFDFRNYGSSQRASFGASARLGGDVAAAAHYLRAHGATRVFLLGASMGGSAVIAGGANVRPAVDGVISVSPAELFADAITSAGRLRVPVLYVAGSFDPGAEQQARHLYSVTRDGRKSILVVDDGRHGYDLVDGSARVRAAIEAFLRRYAKRSA